jgi:hypothetical protein
VCDYTGSGCLENQDLHEDCRFACAAKYDDEPQAILYRSAILDVMSSSRGITLLTHGQPGRFYCQNTTGKRLGKTISSRKIGRWASRWSWSVWIGEGISLTARRCISTVNFLLGIFQDWRSDTTCCKAPPPSSTAIGSKGGY